MVTWMPFRASAFMHAIGMQVLSVESGSPSPGECTAGRHDVTSGMMDCSTVMKVSQSSSPS